MDGIGLDAARPQPARQPETVAGRLIGDGDPFDRMPGPAGFVAPALQKLQQQLRVGIDLLERLTLEARDQPGNQPLRLAHFDDGNDRAILFESGKGPARVK